jgi:hypothetical protein
MMTSRPIDPPTLTPNVKLSNLGAPEVGQNNEEGGDKETSTTGEGDQDMRTTTSPSPSTGSDHHTRTEGSHRDHFVVDNDDRVAEDPTPHTTYPLEVPDITAQGIDDDRAERFATPETKTRWAKLRANGFAVTIWCARHRNEADTAKNQALLTQKISQTLGKPTIPDAMSATAFPKPRAGDIWPFCLSGLSEEDANTLTTRYVWVYEDIQFFVTPHPAPPPTFVATLVRDATLFPDTEVDNKWFADLLRCCIREHHTGLLNFANAYHEKIQVKRKTDARFYLNKILDSLRVSRYQLTDSKHMTRYFYNIHVDFPSTQIDKFPVWKALFEDHNELSGKPYYDLDTLGKVEVLRKSHNCTICKGLDHPSAICPFVKIPGWPAPAPKVETPKGNRETLTGAHRGRGRGKGTNQSRGRGRRGRGT